MIATDSGSNVVAAQLGTRQVSGPLRLGTSAGFAGFRAIAKQRSRLDIILGGGPSFEKFEGSKPVLRGRGKGAG